MIEVCCPRPVGRGNKLKITEGFILRSFSYVKQSWDFFHFLETVTGFGWYLPAGKKISVQPSWYLLPPQKIDPLSLKTGFSGR
jgi:hypothetical protein